MVLTAVVVQISISSDINCSALVSCLAYSSTLKMELTHYSGTSVNPSETHYAAESLGGFSANSHKKEKRKQNYE
jgi:hypothetical protein